MSDDDAAAERAAERARIQRMHFAACVEEMFDDYAPTFEKSLVTELNYKLYNELPGTLDDVQKQQQQQQPGDDDDGTPPPLSATLAVDLGCGTGLAGQALKSRCVGRLVGCDLSRRMLLVAKKKVGVYDELVACDCVAYLHRNVKPATADLIVAADVLVYMRDLADLFDAVVAALRPGGLFAFSTEMASSEEVGGEGGAGGGVIGRKERLLVEVEELLRSIHAEEPRPSFDEACAEIRSCAEDPETGELIGIDNGESDDLIDEAMEKLPDWDEGWPCDKEYAEEEGDEDV